MLGLCYVVVKVALLSVVEIGVFPLIGGWWLDICSLSLFDATLKVKFHIVTEKYNIFRYHLQYSTRCVICINVCVCVRIVR